MRTLTLFGIVLCMSSYAFAGKSKESTTKTGERPNVEQWAARCKMGAGTRDVWPNGAALRGMALRDDKNMQSEVLRDVDLRTLSLDGQTPVGATMSGSRLVASGHAEASLQGATLQGTGADGSAVDVAICKAEESATHVTRYQLRIWNGAEKTWQNPCAPLGKDKNEDPWAIAASGTWDERGTHRQDAQRMTFGCDGGAIAKCAVNFGYSAGTDARNGQERLHQACTRLVRADYCGDGQSHTTSGSTIDVYDAFSINQRTTEASASWDPAKGRLEAGWDQDGAVCIDHTRMGEAVDAVIKQCPGRFVKKTMKLSEGEQCAVQRKKSSPKSVILRNRSYGVAPDAGAKASAE